jgi:hypothetical protein
MRRRYALFTLVGIAGEDDLDAPDLNDGGAPTSGAGNGIQRLPDAPARHRPQGNGKGPRQPILDAQSSAALRDRLVREIAGITSADEGFDWAYQALSKKNTLTASDARLVQLAFELRLSALEAPAEGREDGPQSALAGADEKHGVDPSGQLPPATDHPSSAAGGTKPDPGGARSGGIDKSVLSISEARRYRDKAHIKFVASRSCLVCGRKPCDPHHLRFAQVRALGRKVSDEFTVPLCRLHHRELHRSRNESLWWKKFGLDPIKIAAQLWDRTRSFRPPETGTPVALPASALPLPETGAKGGAGRAAKAGTSGKKSQTPQSPAPGPSGP